MFPQSTLSDPPKRKSGPQGITCQRRTQTHPHIAGNRSIDPIPFPPSHGGCITIDMQPPSYPRGGIFDRPGPNVSKRINVSNQFSSSTSWSSANAGTVPLFLPLLLPGYDLTLYPPSPKIKTLVLLSGSAQGAVNHPIPHHPAHFPLDTQTKLGPSNTYASSSSASTRPPRGRRSY